MVSKLDEMLDSIKEGYKDDAFYIQVTNTAMKGWQKMDDLWYIGDCLLIPHVSNLHETLFHLAHDTLGHFGADKSYTSL